MEKREKDSCNTELDKCLVLYCGNNVFSKVTEL